MFDVAVQDVVSTRQSRRGLVGLLSVTGLVALTFTFTNATITRVEVIGDPARLRDLDIAVL